MLDACQYGWLLVPEIEPLDGRLVRAQVTQKPCRGLAGDMSEPLGCMSVIPLRFSIYAVAEFCAQPLMTPPQLMANVMPANALSDRQHGLAGGKV